jgi:hypothetical protein
LDGGNDTKKNQKRKKKIEKQKISAFFWDLAVNYFINHLNDC